MQVPLTTADFLQRGAQVYAQRLALIDEPEQPAAPVADLTFTQIKANAQHLAANLEQLGLAPGARIAVVSHNSSRLLQMLLAVPTSGRIIVPINFRLTKTEVAFIVKHCGAQALLIDPELEPSLGDIPCQHRWVIGPQSDAILFGDNGHPPAKLPDIDENDTAAINYTSGTTGNPKGVQLTHRNIWLNAATFGWQIGVNDRDIYLHTLPMFHCNGWGMPFALAGMGAKQIVLRKVDGAEILRRIDAHGVTLLCGAPAVLQAIIDAAKQWPGAVPGSGTVRMVVAGAPPPTKLIEEMETVLGWDFIQIYGLTETAPLLTMSRRRQEWDDLTPEERASKLGSAGVPALGVSIRTDDSGEVLARGNVIMHGYWENPIATDAAIADGWFHTGDGGTIDSDAYLRIEDRKKDVIISGGENVSSIEVEDVIFSHPKVAEVAVIGVPDAKWGEAVKALIVATPASELSQEEVISWCRDSLAGYKCPKSIEFRQELARTATGKLQKFKLRQPYWEGQERQVN